MCTSMMASWMHRHPFEGQHLVNFAAPLCKRGKQHLCDVVLEALASIDSTRPRHCLACTRTSAGGQQPPTCNQVQVWAIGPRQELAPPHPPSGSNTRHATTHRGAFARRHWPMLCFRWVTEWPFPLPTFQWWSQPGALSLDETPDLPLPAGDPLAAQGSKPQRSPLRHVEADHLARTNLQQVVPMSLPPPPFLTILTDASDFGWGQSLPSNKRPGASGPQRKGRDTSTGRSALQYSKLSWPLLPPHGSSLLVRTGNTVVVALINKQRLNTSRGLKNLTSKLL